MRVMFFGTPEFAVPTLKALEKEFKIVGVFTQPDSRRSRGMKLYPSPVKEYAISRDYPVYQPEKISKFDLIGLLEETKTDVAVVVAYGQKIPGSALLVPKYDFINVHASLLPKFRGAAPIERSILSGEKETGITIMYMAEGMDTGDIGTQRTIAIDDVITGGELTTKLSLMGAEMAVEFVNLLKGNEAPRIPQNEKEATYAMKITSTDLYASFDEKCDVVLRRIRAFAPDVGVKMTIKGVATKIFKASRAQDVSEVPEAPGTIYKGDKKRLIVSFKDGWVEIEEIQPAAHKRISGAEFIRGYRICD